MTSLEIFQNLEREAIEWGQKHQQAFVGEIVEYSTGKRTRKAKITAVEVVIGRKKRETCFKSFGIIYIGRRLKKDGSSNDKPGNGLLLQNFIKSDGTNIVFEKGNIDEFISDWGLTFCVDHEREADELYPHFYETYKTCKKYPYSI